MMLEISNQQLRVRCFEDTTKEKLAKGLEILILMTRDEFRVKRRDLWALVSLYVFFPAYKLSRTGMGCIRF